jgi:quercetin dioxygenase-like cupin family protein
MEVMMRRCVGVAAFVVLISMTAGVAQTPSSPAGDLVLKPIAASSGQGVSNVPLIDRPEVRVLRVDIAPGGVRNVHSHDDMRYHLFIPTAAGMQFEVESQPAAAAAAWQSQFIPGGTRHGFKNTGTSTVTVVEVFVKK